MNKTKQNIFIITGINEPFLPKATRFIETMSTHSNVNNIVVTLDFTTTDEIRNKYPNIAFIPLSSDKVKSPNPNTCLQHGGFLPALDHLPDDTIIIFTDADICVQRGFTPDELERLSSFNKQEIGVGYNEAISQTLTMEMNNLEPLITPERILTLFPKCDQYAVYNTGVLVAQKQTYHRLYKEYVDQWNKINSALNHYAKQQWLLSYLIQSKFSPRLLSDEIHTHDHHPIKLRVNREYGHKFCIANTPVVFSHRIPEYTAPSIWNKKIRQYKKAKLKWKRIGCISSSLTIILLITLLILLFN